MKVIVTDDFSEKKAAFRGNKFLTGNGYMGIRGTLEEYTKHQQCAINLSGIYDRVGDAWRESVNAPNVFYTYIKINGRILSVLTDEPCEHEQRLDWYNALQCRKSVWRLPEGEVTVYSERFAVMGDMHRIAMKYTLKTDFDCFAEIITATDADVWDINGPHLEKITCRSDENEEIVSAYTHEKNILITAQSAVNVCFDGQINAYCDELHAVTAVSVNAKAGCKYRIEKVSVISTSADETLCRDNAYDFSYDELKKKHSEAWLNIWRVSEIEIFGDDEAMYALNYSIYHLNCIAPRNIKSRSIPARGLSAQVYKGAVFWDTEMFMIDYYIHTEPEIAKTLIKYRIDTLGGARTKAEQYGLDGAYYAWESQEGGYEACSDYNVVDVFTKRPMRTHFRDKQYHVSAAVVYAIYKYLRATDDYSILSEGAAEVALECARMYRSLLLKRIDSNLYEIHDVVGPDEYHERVNNNVYTNSMASFTLKMAAKLLRKLKEIDSKVYDEIKCKYNSEKLIEEFENINIYVPHPRDKDGLIEQFDGYFKLEDVSVAEVRSRLLDPKEYWGGAYGVASGTQVIKQADVVAMLSIFKDNYSKEIMKNNWAYYEPRTEHGSSLSACMYSLLACFIDNPDTAYPLFMKSASADLTEGGKEWAGLVYIGGTHPASEGGAWIVAVNGFAGVTVSDGKLECYPSLPEKWQGMRFKYLFKGKLYEITVDKNGGAVELTTD